MTGRAERTRQRRADEAPDGESLEHQLKQRARQSSCSSPSAQSARLVCLQCNSARQPVGLPVQTGEQLMVALLFLSRITEAQSIRFSLSSCFHQFRIVTLVAAPQIQTKQHIGIIGLLISREWTGVTPQLGLK